MPRRRFAMPLFALIAAGCDWATPKPTAVEVAQSERNAARDERIKRACASASTYDRLKELAFDDARRLRKTESPLLDQLATHSVIRMEEPVVKSRDEGLNVTVCTGRLILELPPGVADAFDGSQRLSADVEYAAQAAADGSGLVYQMEGAEPIIYRLAALEIGRRPAAPGRSEVVVAQASDAPPPQELEEEEPELSPPPPPPPRVVIPPPVVREPARAEIDAPPAPSPQRAQARPSFNCRYARSRVEKMICADERLAAQDRRMASLFYATVAVADAETKAEIRRSRDGFLARRDRCASAGCVSGVYDARIAELREYGLAEP